MRVSFLLALMCFFVILFSCNNKKLVVYEPRGNIENDKEIIKSFLWKSYALRNVALLFSSAEDIQELTTFNLNEVLEGGMRYNFPICEIHPEQLELNLIPVDLMYPLESFRLYFVKFELQEGIKGEGSIWYTNRFSWISNFETLVAINNAGEIKIVSSPGLMSSISNDFKLNKLTPKSYISYLSFKLMSYKIQDIQYKERKGDTLFFRGTRTYDDEVDTYEIFINSNNPDGNINIKKIEGPNRTANLIVHNQTDLKDYSIKKVALKAVLANGIFNYRVIDYINKNPEIKKTLTSFVLPDFEIVNKLFPEYNQFLSGINFVEIDYNRVKERCSTVWGDFQGLIADDNLKVYGVELSKDIDYYWAYRDSFEYLRTKLPEIHGGGWDSNVNFLHDPEAEKEYDDHIVEYGKPPTPPNPLPGLGVFAGNPECTPYGLPFSKDVLARTRFYLIGLNKKSNDWFFVSGQDVLLSPVTHLYPTEFTHESFSDDPKWIFNYIRDRLYSYQVPVVNKDNIIRSTPEELILEADGNLRGEDIRIRATLYYANPEIVEVEVLE